VCDAERASGLERGEKVGLRPIGDKRAARVVAAAYGNGRRAGRARRRLAGYLRRARRPSSVVVDAIWDAWLADADEAVWDLLRQKGRYARRHLDLSMAILDDGIPDAGVIVWAAAREGHPLAGMARRRILASRADREFVNEVHREALAHPSVAAFCAENGLAPVPPDDLVPRAAFLLVHRLSEQYRAADPEGALLARAYQDGDFTDRDEIREAMGELGDLELIRTVIGERPRYPRSDQMPDSLHEDVGYLGEQYAERGEWDRLWRLALDAPLADAVALVRHLTGWSPQDDAGRALLGRLAAITPDAVEEAGARLLAARRVELEGYFEPPKYAAFAADNSRVVMAGKFSRYPPADLVSVDFSLGAAFHLPSGKRSGFIRPRDLPLLAQVGDMADLPLIPDPDTGAGYGGSSLVLTRGVPYRGGYLVRGESVSEEHGAWMSWGQPPVPVTPGTLGLPGDLPGWPLRVEIAADPVHNVLAAYGPRLLVLRDGRGPVRAREADLADVGAVRDAVFCGPGRLITVSGRSEGDWVIDELRCWRREGNHLSPGPARPGIDFWCLTALPAYGVVIAGGRWFTADTLQEIEAPYGMSTGRGVSHPAVWASPDGTYLAVRTRQYQPGSQRFPGGSVEIHDIGSSADLRLLRAPMGDATPADLHTLDGASSDVIDLLRACLRYRFRRAKR
jgi:hypothetical protein